METNFYMIKHMSLACLFAIALMVVPGALAYMSYGDDGPVDWKYVQANNVTCCGGGPDRYKMIQGKDFSFWNSCKRGELVKRICIRTCYDNDGSNVLCGLGHYAFSSIEITWTDAKTLSETRRETIGKFNKKAKETCIDLQVDRNERITYAEMRTGIADVPVWNEDLGYWSKPKTHYPGPQYIKLVTNSGKSMTAGEPYDLIKGHTWMKYETIVWKNGDPSILPTNYLGSGFLCGLSGRVGMADYDLSAKAVAAGPWINELRFNFLPEISSAELQNATWSTKVPVDPDGTTSLDSQSSSSLFCGSPRSMVQQMTFKHQSSYSLSTTTSRSSTWGMKLGNKLTLSAEKSTGVEIAKAKISASLELSQEYSKSGTTSDETTESEQKIQEHTTTNNLTCPDLYGNMTYPLQCVWKNYYVFAFKWDKAKWEGKMVYQLASGGIISVPTSGATSGGFYDSDYKQEVRCTEAPRYSMKPINATSADANTDLKTEAGQSGGGSRKLLLKRSV